MNKIKDHSPVLNISPIDGRYSEKTRKLSNYFSEFALFHYRIEVEVKYFIYLFQKINETGLSYSIAGALHDLYNNFNLVECEKIKAIEKNCNHDVKAVEYYLIAKFKELGIYNQSNLIHFGLTSQDINNTAITYSLKEYICNEYIPQVETILGEINEKAFFWKDVIMMSRTHGQPAVPTSMGKEIQVFHYRITKQLSLLKQIQYYGKFGGAVGNLNAHYLAYPEINWHQELTQFLKDSFSLEREKYTTQIDNYENLSTIFDNIRRINTIMVDMCRDIWQYISMEYFNQEFLDGEVGSSTMPQKINPIDFENAEGNLMLASNLFDFLSNKLPISRLQRDLTDSTVLRNLGTVFGHVEIALVSLKKGFGKIIINPIKLHNDLNEHIEIITEGIQTLLRREGKLDAYDSIKELARNNKKMTYDELHKFIQNLDIGESTKIDMYNLTPSNYIGKSQ
jgi:adenylosuccinate lyase